MTIIRPSRRDFLKGMAAAGGAAFAGTNFATLAHAAPAPSDLKGLREKIEHIVVIVQENRSFDHYFGAYQSPSGAFGRWMPMTNWWVPR